MNEVEVIKNAVCKSYNLSVNELEANNDSRATPYREIRQVCHYFACKYIKTSLGKIGSDFGEKDHATVLHSKKVVYDTLDTDPKFRARLIKIKTALDKELGSVFYDDEELPDSFKDKIDKLLETLREYQNEDDKIRYIFPEIKGNILFIKIVYNLRALAQPRNGRILYDIIFDTKDECWELRNIDKATEVYYNKLSYLRKA